MVGQQKGVQSRIARKFNPCGLSHSLNLFVAGAAKTSVKYVSLFGIPNATQQKRWEVIAKHLNSLTLIQYGNVESTTCRRFVISTLK